MDKQSSYIIAVLVVVILALAGYFGYMYWHKHHHVQCGPPRHRAVYPSYGYPSGSGARGHRVHRDHFSGDEAGWPGSGVIGNLADTNPYGNYAGHVDLYWPTYSEGAYQNLYWSQT